MPANNRERRAHHDSAGPLHANSLRIVGYSKQHRTPKRMRSMPYCLGRAPGLADMSHPLMTGCRKPLLTKRSRCIRLSSPVRKMCCPSCWRSCRAAREAASFSLGVAICFAPLQVHYAVSIHVYYGAPIQVTYTRFNKFILFVCPGTGLRLAGVKPGI